MDGHCIARAKIQKLGAQYLGERDHWGKRVLTVLEIESAVNTRDIILFVHEVCENLNARIPENELKEWAAFEPDTLDHAVGEFDHGLNDLINLAKKFEALLEEADDTVPGRICQQSNKFKFMVNEKRKIGLLK